MINRRAEIDSTCDVLVYPKCEMCILGWWCCNAFECRELMISNRKKAVSHFLMNHLTSSRYPNVSTLSLWSLLCLSVILSNAINACSNILSNSIQLYRIPFLSHSQLIKSPLSRQVRRQPLGPTPLQTAINLALMLIREPAIKKRRHDPEEHNRHPIAKSHMARIDSLRIPLLTDLQELLRIVRDDAVHFLADVPLHHVGLVDGPDEDGPLGGFGFADEVGAARAHEGCLEHVEGDVGDFEELAGVGD